MEEKDEKILRENIEYIVSKVLEKINEAEEKKDKKKSNGKVDMVVALINTVYLLQQDIIFDDTGWSVQF